MKNKKLSLSKLNLNKMKISSLQSVKGGNVDDGMDDGGSGSMNTAMTDIPACCKISKPMTGVCCRG